MCSQFNLRETLTIKREATELRSGDFLKNEVLERNCCHRWAAANTVGTWRGAGPLAVI